MDFKLCPRAIGRPKKRRFGAPSLLKSQRQRPEDDKEEKEDNDAGAEKKKRGRPKGSKNKPKTEEPPLKKMKTFRERAEIAASWSLTEDSELCMICGFRFDDPLKRTRKLRDVQRATNCVMNHVSERVDAMSVELSMSLQFRIFDSLQ